MKRQKRTEDGAVQRYHHGDLRAALMKAALKLIDEHGVKGFSLKDAAALAGVSTAAPYRHFADKDALIFELQEEGFALFNAALAAANARGTTPGSRIVELGVAFVLFAMANPAYFRVMFGLAHGQAGEPDPSRISGFLLLVDGVAALLPEAEAQVRVDLVVACWSLVHGFALLQIEGVFDGTIQIGDVEGQLRGTLSLMIERTTSVQI